MKLLKRSSIVLLSVATLLFIFTSCFSNGSKKVLEKFFHDFKNKEIISTYEYLIDNQEKNIYKEYMENLINVNKDGSKGEFRKLNDAMAKKIFDFKYEILESKKIDNKNMEIKINYQFYDFSKVYENALDDFLNKSLNFDNLENLYTEEYIINLVIEHINRVKKEEKQVTVKLVRENGFKILMEKDLVELLTGNSIKLVDSIKDNIIKE